MSTPWSSQSSYRGPEQRALDTINRAANDGTRDFQRNLSDLNQSVAFMSQYLVTMQKGIDDANKNIIQKVQDFIQDLIIIFGGGDTGDSGFDFGDLKYIIQAIGALFGFTNVNGEIDLLGAAANFLSNFLAPLGAFADLVNGFIKAVFEFFAGLLSNVPVVGDVLEDIVTNIAGGINTTNSTANTAQSTAIAAQGTATSAQSTASAAQSAATTAQTQASNAANAAAVAADVADEALVNSQSEMFALGITTSGVTNGTNEQVQGILITCPDDRVRIIRRIILTLKENTGGLTVDLIHQGLDGTETIIHSTTVSGSALVVPDSSIEYEVTDLDRFYGAVRDISGIQTGLNLYLETALLIPEEAP